MPQRAAKKVESRERTKSTPVSPIKSLKVVAASDKPLPALDFDLPPEIIDGDIAVLLRKDAEEAVKRLAQSAGGGRALVRYLVDSYYNHQQSRIRSANRTRKALEAGNPPELMRWIMNRDEMTEVAIASFLDRYTKIEPTGMGVWARSHIGVGPVIAAGLLALINLEIATTPSKIWRFFGLDPTVVWKAGEKRPWCAQGKVLQWKLGTSFVKCHNKPDCFYGKLYEQRKALEIARNENGLNRETARLTLEQRRITEPHTLAAYQAGKLPDGRIDARARRWAVKIFLAHYWEEAQRRRGVIQIRPPYAIEKLGHTTMIQAPAGK